MTKLLTLRLHTLLTHSPVLNTQTHVKKHALTHANSIAGAEVPYSLRVKWAGCIHLHSHGLHVCLFFPEGAPPALGRQWKSCWCVTGWGWGGGGGEAPRPGLESPIGTQCPGEGSAPTGGTALQRRDCGGALNTLKMQHRYCFTQGQVLLQFREKKMQVQAFHLNLP